VTDALLELRNVALCAALIIQCAMKRKESRGLHCTTDYPQRDDEHFLSDTIVE
jgi:L-aspartate oxidase